MGPRLRGMSLYSGYRLEQTRIPEDAQAGVRLRGRLRRGGWTGSLDRPPRVPGHSGAWAGLSGHLHPEGEDFRTRQKDPICGVEERREPVQGRGEAAMGRAQI